MMIIQSNPIHIHIHKGVRCSTSASSKVRSSVPDEAQSSWSLLLHLVALVRRRSRWNLTRELSSLASCIRVAHTDTHTDTCYYKELNLLESSPNDEGVS